MQRKGLACRATSYVITGPGNERQRKAALTWCKTKDGWKMASLQATNITAKADDKTKADDKDKDDKSKDEGPKAPANK